MKTTIDNNQATPFVNLFAQIKEEENKRLTEFNELLGTHTTVESVLKTWYFYHLLPKSKNGYKWASLVELVAYLQVRKQKELSKTTAKGLDRLNTISEAGEVIDISISVEWKKSRMWGSNPSATANVHTTKGWFRFDSGSIGGCGYDKQSTAVASVLNQCNALLNMMCKVKNERPTDSNRDVFGYGAGYGITPSIEGGVGVSCYPAIMETLGLTFKTVASGKSFDAYQIAKLS